MWTYRKLSFLIDTPLFKDFIKKFNLEVYIIGGTSILLYNRCIYIYIYSFIIENVCWCEIINMDANVRCEMTKIEYYLSGNTTNIYKKYRDSYNKTYGDPSIPHQLTIEQQFFAKIEIFNTYLNDLLRCQMEKREKYFEPMRDTEIESFENVLREAKKVTIE
ncbi:MAG: hypothetical protein RL662_643 [Bacteroidota bacterium]|jgi:hypothetical protein